jgi:hypothetical protein
LAIDPFDLKNRSHTLLQTPIGTLHVAEVLPADTILKGRTASAFAYVRLERATPNVPQTRFPSLLAAIVAESLLWRLEAAILHIRTIVVEATTDEDLDAATITWLNTAQGKMTIGFALRLQKELDQVNEEKLNRLS